MGGSSGGRTTSRTTTVLPPGQQQNVDLLMQGARDLYAGGGPQFYPGQTYAGPTQPMLQGRQQATGYAGGVGQDFVNQAVQGEKFWLNPENIFNPSNIPGFNAAQEGVTRRATENLTQNILPQVRSGSIATGGLGGSRQGIGEGLAVGETNKALTDSLANMNLGAYNQGLNMYSQAQNRAPQTYALGLAPSETLGIVGQQQQAEQQQMIDEMMSRFNFEQLRPMMNLETLKNLTGSANQYGGTQSASGTQGQSDGGSQGMQLAGTVIMAAAIM